MTSELKILQLISYLFGFASVVFLLLFLQFSRREISDPIDALTNAMNRVKAGNLDVRVESKPLTDDFSTMNSTFNSLVSQIEELKINVYEQKIDNQKAMLDFYQLQISPHFFINSLNTIFSFAQLQDFLMVKNITKCLITHFRYTLYSNKKSKLSEEISFTANYLEMQRICYGNRLNYSICTDISSSLTNAYVPVLILQTFIENSIRHNLDTGKNIEINVTAYLEYGNDKKFINIIIFDNGKGFDEDSLKVLNSGEQYIDHRGKHIGIYNICRRLFLLYGNEAHAEFSNRLSSGAEISIRIPYEEGE